MNFFLQSITKVARVAVAINMPMHTPIINTVVLDIVSHGFLVSVYAVAIGFVVGIVVGVMVGFVVGVVR